MQKVEIRRSAEFSACRTWRYTLDRRWGFETTFVLFVLLNPSTADEVKDDPTNRRGIAYAMEWGYEGVSFVNLFAIRTKDPYEMKNSPDKLGPDNDEWIMQRAREADRIVLAWGNHGTHLERDQRVLRMLKDFELFSLGENDNGTPKHILYLSGDLKPHRFPPDE